MAVMASSTPTETAVLKVVSDILRASDRGDVTLLCLLDMSAAFDTVDHDLLIHRLSTAFGFQGKVLSWIESFIRHRSQTVSFGEELSAESNVVCGVPQGSVLGPILFLLYTADVITIANHHGIKAHSYADDTQLYCHSPESLCEALPRRVIMCMSAIEQWITSNRLKLNADKTKFMWLGTKRAVTKVE